MKYSVKKACLWLSRHQGEKRSFRVTNQDFLTETTKHNFFDIIRTKQNKKYSVLLFICDVKE